MWIMPSCACVTVIVHVHPRTPYTYPPTHWKPASNTQQQHNSSCERWWWQNAQRLLFVFRLPCFQQDEIKPIIRCHFGWLVIWPSVYVSVSAWIGGLCTPRRAIYDHSRFRTNLNLLFLWKFLQNYHNYRLGTVLKARSRCFWHTLLMVIICKGGHNIWSISNLKLIQRPLLAPFQYSVFDNKHKRMFLSRCSILWFSDSSILLIYCGFIHRTVTELVYWIELWLHRNEVDCKMIGWNVQQWLAPIQRIWESQQSMLFFV